MPAYTDILTNSSRTLYVALTDDRRRRASEHKTQLYEDAFTPRCRVTQVAYYEVLADGPAALAREARLKRWTRAKKIALIGRMNPGWSDLGDRWFPPDETETLTMGERPFNVSDLLLPRVSASHGSAASG